MRGKLDFIVVLASIMLVVPCFAALPPVTDGLVGFWNFEQGSLVTAFDMSGNANDGTMMNTTYADPPPGTASTASLRFNSTQNGPAYSYIAIPDSPSLRPSSNLTLVAWVKSNALQYRPCVIIGKQFGAGVYYDSYILWYEWNLLNFYIKTGTSEKRIWIDQPSVDVWHHIVATYDGSIMRLYVDGVEEANGAFSGAIDYTDNPVTIGADSDRADHVLEQGWDGFIDEVMIYNRSLTLEEILQIFAPYENEPPTMTILSPENKTYAANTGISLTFTVDESTKWMGYSLDGQTNVTITGNATLPTLSDGPHYVFVYANDTFGNMGKTTAYFTVDTIPPTANAGSAQTVDEDSVVTFDGSASTDENGVATYTWTFTDGTPKTLTGENPTYTFTTPGTYLVTLVVADAAGNTATQTVTITVHDVTEPVADAGQDQTADVGATVSFDAGGSTDNVGIVSYEWDFGDGSSGTGKTTTHEYANAGTYTATLTVKDAAGNIATNTMRVTVNSAEGFPWWILLVVLLIVVGVIIAVLVLWKRRKKTSEPTR